MKTNFQKLVKPVDPDGIKRHIAQLVQNISAASSADAEQILSCIDLTTLDVRDTEEKIAQMCGLVNHIPEIFKIRNNVAGLCVYPVFVPAVKRHLSAPGVNIVSVAAGFPSGQTPLDIKLKETEFAVQNGAAEIDIVIPVGKIITGKLEQVTSEIRAIKQRCGDQIVLKVILESGLYENKAFLQNAAYCALEGGADFLKTSTGKVQPAARPLDVWIMAEMIKAYFAATGRKAGIKAAGGIAAPEEALLYMNIVRAVLGEEWVSPSFFRIGASRLANTVLSLLAPDTGNSYF